MRGERGEEERRKRKGEERERGEERRGVAGTVEEEDMI